MVSLRGWCRGLLAAGLLAGAAVSGRAADDVIERALASVRNVKRDMFARTSSVLGELPGPDYGFRVSLRHGSGSPRYTSSLQEDTQWEIELPGDVVGEWRWSVAVVRRGETLVLARSDEWTFYYDPFEGPSTSSSPPDSPLPTPPESPLSLP